MSSVYTLCVGPAKLARYIDREDRGDNEEEGRRLGDKRESEEKKVDPFECHHVSYYTRPWSNVDLVEATFDDRKILEKTPGLPPVQRTQARYREHIQYGRQARSKRHQRSIKGRRRLYRQNKRGISWTISIATSTSINSTSGPAEESHPLQSRAQRGVSSTATSGT